MFIGRKNELATLEDLYTEDVFQCVIIYGRRRVGKTTMLSEFCKSKNHIFFSAQETTSSAMLKDFSKKVYNKFKIKNLPSFESWEQALLFIGEKAKEERLLVVFDEFPYLARADKAIKSLLQNTIDHALKDTKLFLAICGSQVSFMEKEVLGYNSPLYGRRTAQMRIEPFTFAESKLFFPNYNIIQQIEAYSILGGIPLYLEQFDDKRSIEKNILEKILKKQSYLYEEPKNLLKQELREPMNYNAIIEAIASGASNMNTIIGKSKISSEHCSRYLNTLQELLLVSRELPVGEPVTSRKGIYKIKDSFFYFWYKFLFPNISDLELGMIEEIMDEEILPQLSAFVGHVFEDVCQQHLINEMKNHNLPYRFSHIGHWWGNNPIEKKQDEIDIYAIGKKGIYLGECKWRNEPIDMDILQNLLRRSQQIFPHANTVTYVLYSKSGFTSSVKEYSHVNNNLLLYDLTSF